MNQQPLTSPSSESITLIEKPKKQTRLKSRSSSMEKNCEIHPEISMEQIQNSTQGTLNKNRHLKKRLLLMERENGQIASSVCTEKGKIDVGHRWELQDQTYSNTPESEIPPDLLELHTMFNFKPGSHCLIRNETKNVRQRRNSTIACSMANKPNIRVKKVEEKFEGHRQRRRLSVATMTGPSQRQERRQEKSLYERLTMIESIDNEEEVDDTTISEPKIEKKCDSVSSLQTPQSRSAVHYLSISPPRIKVTDESNKMKNRRLESPRYGSASNSKISSSTTSISCKKVTSNPELNLPDRTTTSKTYSKSPNTSSISSRESSPLSSCFSDRNQNDSCRRRSSYCLAVPNQYSNCTTKRRLSLPTTSHKLYYVGPNLQPPPISYSKLQSSSSSSGNVSSSRILRYKRDEYNSLERNKRTFPPQVQNSSTSPSSSDTQKGASHASHTAAFIKRQSSSSIASYSSQTESYVPSSGSSSNPNPTTSSSSSSNEVPEHRSSCASIHSFSTHASSRCYSISDSRRSSAATDTWNKSFCSGMTSTRSRYLALLITFSVNDFYIKIYWNFLVQP